MEARVCDHLMRVLARQLGLSLACTAHFAALLRDWLPGSFIPCVRFVVPRPGPRLPLRRPPPRLHALQEFLSDPLQGPSLQAELERRDAFFAALPGGSSYVQRFWDKMCVRACVCVVLRDLLRTCLIAPMTATCLECEQGIDGTCTIDDGHHRAPHASR